MVSINGNFRNQVYFQGKRSKDDIKREIKELEADLAKQMATPPKTKDNKDWACYNIYMDNLQERIAKLRKECPVDRTNLDEVMMAKPMDYFAPQKADNVKGKGISFSQIVPDDPEKLEKVTYKAVPIFTNARTIEEMIRIGKRDGINIETIKFSDNGEYRPATKNIWHKGKLDDKKGYFEINRPGVIIQYGKYSKDDEYVNNEWGAKNADKDGNIMDSAVVANDFDGGLRILSKSYVHKGGAPITKEDMTNWNGFKVHKDKNATVNAVAFDKEMDLNTLEGPIKTDVTMGDVEGFVYNDFNELKKQITKNKIGANPMDPNSAKFVEFMKNNEDEKGKEFLRQITKETM